ncbi:MAG: acyl-CoA thioesterase [Bacteroidetes bacterium]|nr:acyl-CoA thioesterase [Bacteroidota bacterium]
MNYTYQLPFTVRDYELDLQGIVNNAVYQNYLEHARHEYLKENGLNFQQLHNDGFDAVVIRAEIDYKKSLISNDQFIVKIGIEREGRLRLIFNQVIIRTSDDAIIVKAKIIVACVVNNRPVEPIIVLEKLGLV